ncbi:winged helix-turn-helix transcriptional regulator [Flectobacillus major]|uniref:winged helix-turn-helix transcriptional regulator n=1 Tax=Flectobacillus major TaxID=103 RepID=UPI0003FF7388|nr:helix-turn-helix domain-containing protein [Flectobacillus major]
MQKRNHKECASALIPVQDALDVISGKWKLLILISIGSGNNRFRLIERSIPRLTSKVLAKELKDLEEHQLIKRTVHDESPVVVEYTTTEYSESLQSVILALQEWGLQHRRQIIG